MRARADCTLRRRPRPVVGKQRHLQEAHHVLKAVDAVRVAVVAPAFRTLWTAKNARLDLLKGSRTALVLKSIRAFASLPTAPRRLELYG